MNYLQLQQQYKEESLFGRYIALKHIEPLLSQYSVEVIGFSVLNKPIYQLECGTGAIKILMWSQMHGNESTTTKALFDFLNFLHSETPESQQLLRIFRFCILPMLNPDGAALYTRENANKVDLNRDAQNLSQPESQILRAVFNRFQPHYCYNLHDQRTIFGLQHSEHDVKPATVSFLAPAYNEAREINEVRLKAISVIVAMNKALQALIPGQVGRFDDSFNLNCVGDTFQHVNVPTILFEAGHFPKDYEREETRKYIFTALVAGIQYLRENDVVNNKTEDYLNIPQNKVVFYDFVYKNVKINYDDNEKIINFAAQYKEVLQQDKVTFEAKIAQVGGLENFFGHITVDAERQVYTDGEYDFPNIERNADFCLGKNIKIVNGLVKT
ncbi:M14 family metallopeptidase [Flavobacterium sp.]|uniref:M14 family metallopeptidase n=1 Tax=Flavobacterium sp. TaxID=239 RepID=UPI002FDDCDEE